MKAIHFLHFFFGVFVGIVAFAMLGILFLLLTFNLAGGETLEQLQGHRWLLMILTMILAGVFTNMTFRWVKGKRRIVAYGSRVVIIVAVIAATGYLVDGYVYTAFDKQIWDRSVYKPFRMAAGVSKTDNLMGFSETKIKSLLGTPAEEFDYIGNGKSGMIYNVDDGWILRLDFADGKLTEMELRSPSMMT